MRCVKATIRGRFRSIHLGHTPTSAQKNNPAVAHDTYGVRRWSLGLVWYAALQTVAGELLRLLRQSGRPDSNRRRPAWEAGILPLNYAREERSECKAGDEAAVDKGAGSSAAVPTAYFAPDASRKLRRSGSLIARSPGEAVSRRPFRLQPSR